MWIADEQEKAELMDGYKNKLSNINCQYFQFGEGTCRFGSSCFYRHAFKDGTLAERMPTFRGTVRGTVEPVAEGFLLSQFIFRD